MSGKIHLFVSGLMFFVLSAFLTPVLADGLSGKTLVNDYCAACHEQGDDGGLSRISDVRKTPEGWDMTIFRMQHVHGLELEDDERFAIIKYLSAEYGLTPQEAEPFRYAIENRAYFIDVAPNDDLDALCGRCHTNARYGLQRRTADDWLKHMHFHAGQFPSLEYHARSRDRYWWQEVTTKTYKELASLYPFQNDDWDKWKTAEHKSPVGSWRVAGHRPGLGDYQGVMTVLKDGDYFKAEYDLYDMDGNALSGDSKSVIYTGYEWRGSGALNGVETREVYALSEDGDQMIGRWYEAAHYDMGGEFKAVRIKGSKAQILIKSSDYIRLGENKKITLHGVGLNKKISADKGLSVKVIKRNKTSVTLNIIANKDLVSGSYKVAVGQAETEITVYDMVDSVRVYPEWTIARVGGGTTPPVTAQFEAVAYMKGKDGKIGSDDDIKIGIMPAEWNAVSFDEEAEHMKDAEFAGTINQQGNFMPAGAGPNPKRKYATNNAGNLRIIANVKDGDRLVKGNAHLIVTVQRWNQPPVR